MVGTNKVVTVNGVDVFMTHADNASQTLEVAIANRLQALDTQAATFDQSLTQIHELKFPAGFKHTSDIQEEIQETLKQFRDSANGYFEKTAQALKALETLITYLRRGSQDPSRVGDEWSEELWKLYDAYGKAVKAAEEMRKQVNTANMVNNLAAYEKGLKIRREKCIANEQAPVKSATGLVVGASFMGGAAAATLSGGSAAAGTAAAASAAAGTAAGIATGGVAGAGAAGTVVVAGGAATAEGTLATAAVLAGPGGLGVVACVGLGCWVYGLRKLKSGIVQYKEGGSKQDEVTRMTWAQSFEMLRARVSEAEVAGRLAMASYYKAFEDMLAITSNITIALNNMFLAQSTLAINLHRKSTGLQAKTWLAIKERDIYNLSIPERSLSEPTIQSELYGPAGLHCHLAKDIQASVANAVQGRD